MRDWFFFFAGTGQCGKEKANTPERHAQRSGARVATMFKSLERIQNSNGRRQRSARASRRWLRRASKSSSPSGQRSMPRSCAGAVPSPAFRRLNSSSVPMGSEGSMVTCTRAWSRFAKCSAALFRYALSENTRKHKVKPCFPARSFCRRRNAPECSERSGRCKRTCPAAAVGDDSAISFRRLLRFYVGGECSNDWVAAPIIDAVVLQQS